jgi:hypothetical protein
MEPRKITGYNDEIEFIVINHVIYIVDNGISYKSKLKNGLSLNYLLSDELYNNHEYGTDDTNDADDINKKNTIQLNCDVDENKNDEKNTIQLNCDDDENKNDEKIDYDINNNWDITCYSNEILQGIGCGRKGLKDSSLIEFSLLRKSQYRQKQISNKKFNNLPKKKSKDIKNIKFNKLKYGNLNKIITRKDNDTPIDHNDIMNNNNKIIYDYGYNDDDYDDYDDDDEVYYDFYYGY